MSAVKTHAYHCPYCGETITGIVDLSIEAQRYIEDCEVCCQPIEIAYSVVDGDITSFTAMRGDD